MDRNYCVYKHTSPSGKVYIGQTGRNPEARWGNNGYCYHSSPYFKSAIDRYGWSNFEHEVLYTGLTKDEACKLEVELIAKYNSNDRRYGYNLTSGGEKNFTYEHTEEEKFKMRNAKRRNQHTVWQIDLNTLTVVGVFDNISQAARDTGVTRASISAVCNGKRINAYGYGWAFEGEEDRYFNTDNPLRIVFRKH